MRDLRKTSAWMIAIAFCVTGLPADPTVESRNPTLKLTPELIEMGAFYNGAQMRIEGMVEDGSKVIVVIRGPNVTEVFNKKERVGPIWVNSGKVHISGVPSLFLRFGSGPVNAILDREDIEKYQLDEDAIKKQMQVEPNVVAREIIQANYLKLKTQEGSYQVINDGIKMGSPGEAGTHYSVEFLWPKKAPPGSYDVKVYECRGGTVVRQASAPLNVVEVGFPARIALLASERASLYGAVSVIVAMLAGFGIDFLATRVFGKKRRAAH